jgi:hypothetical protein
VRRGRGAQPAHQVGREAHHHVAPECDGQKDTEKKRAAARAASTVSVVITVPPSHMTVSLPNKNELTVVTSRYGLSHNLGGCRARSAIFVTPTGAGAAVVAGSRRRSGLSLRRKGETDDA